MKRVDDKQRKRYRRQSNSAIKKRQKVNRRKKRNPRKEKSSDLFSTYTYKVKAPEVFSLIENPDGTIQFFERVLDGIKKSRSNQRIYFDMEDILKVSPDAVVYLIAIMCSSKRLKMLRISCSGNLPKNDYARGYFESVGFYAYVRRLKFNPGKDFKNDNISTRYGNDVDSQLISEICEFVLKGCGAGDDLMETKRLYSMLIELMTNTKQHAYNGMYNELERNWYMYVERDGGKSRFVFLDTGDGIPSTIHYKLKEHVSKLIGNEDDAYYIASALRGEFRTETQQEYRGKGLPEIYRGSIDGNISNVSIISGRGKCDILANGDISENRLDNKFLGTLFQWEFRCDGELSR